MQMVPPRADLDGPGVRALRAFVEEMKASGFVARALERSGQNEVVVAPPTPI